MSADPEIALCPVDTEERLGVETIREHIVGKVRSDYGRRLVESLRPSCDPERVRRRLAGVDEMQALLRLGESPPLAAIGDQRDRLVRSSPADARIEADELAELGGVLRSMRLLVEFMKARKDEAPSLWDIARRIEPLPSLEARIEQTVHDDGRIREDASPELRQISRRLSEREEDVRNELQRALRSAISQGWATEEQPTIRAGRAVLPIRAEAKRKIQGFVHDVSATGQTVYVEPASVLELNNEIRELETARGHEIDRILREVTALVGGRRPEVEENLRAFGLLDAISAVARHANEVGALAPEIEEKNTLRLVQARNPVLLLHIREVAELDNPREVIPLNLELGDEAKTLIITGPNAGGKSVALKTVGLFSILTAMGIPVPAAPGTRIPIPTQLFVDVGDQQSIEDDLSTFTSHLKILQRTLKEADDRSLVLIDEAGTGTDPAEGGALAETVLARLTKRGALTIATTHHGTLKAFAHNTDGVVNGSMVFDRKSLAPTYRFQAGIPGSSYAFEIAHRVGLDEPVVDDARRLVGEGKSRLEDLIATLERVTEEATERRDEADRQAREAQSVKEDYEHRRDELRSQRDRLKSQALTEAERIVKEANAEVERTIREIKEAEAEKEATRRARASLEAAKRSVQSRRDTLEKQKTGGAKAAQQRSEKPITVGDRVQIEEAEAVGEVIECDDEEAVVALGAFTSRVKLKRLTRVGGPRKKKRKITGAAAHVPRKTHPAFHYEGGMRLDLRGQRVEEALHQTQRFIDEAISSGLASVEILHGKGTGALRQAVQESLTARPDIVSFDQAPWDRGGDGVTIVQLQ